jgi:hypothetical protein
MNSTSARRWEPAEGHGGRSAAHLNGESDVCGAAAERGGIVASDGGYQRVGNDQEAPKVKEYRFEGGYGEYPIEIFGVDGAYVVCAVEHDDAGVCGTLDEAESYVVMVGG